MANNKTKIIINSIVILRILTLLIIAATIVLILTNNFVFNETKTKFSDINAYRYVLGVGIAGALYTLIQLPFGIYNALKMKTMIRGNFLPYFDFYGDKAISFLLLSGVCVGLGVSIELRDNVDYFVDTLEFLGVTGIEDYRSKSKKFLDRGIIATCVLFGAFITMVLISNLTALVKSGKS